MRQAQELSRIRFRSKTFLSIDDAKAIWSSLAANNAFDFIDQLSLDSQYHPYQATFDALHRTLHD